MFPEETLGGLRNPEEIILREDVNGVDEDPELTISWDGF